MGGTVWIGRSWCHPRMYQDTNGATHVLWGSFWGAELKFGDNSANISLDLGPEDGNWPESAQTGGAVLRAQHKNLASDPTQRRWRQRFRTD